MNGPDAHGCRIVALVPAHNEEEQIADAIESLLAQTTPVQVVICTDNCTDSTVEIARRYPVTVFETVGNTAKKAGALNQGWDRYGRDAEMVFTMDADTVLIPRCVELLVENLEGHGGVCACPAMKPVDSHRLRDRLLYRLIRLDYGGARRLTRLRKNRVEVLAGMGALFRGHVLREVAGDGLPWHTDSIVEDYRLTLEVRRLGYQIAAVPAAIGYTDGLVNLGDLWRQRVRWASGTWQELGRLGWKPYTRKVWFALFVAMLGSLVRLASIALWVLTFAVLHSHFHLRWIWLAPLVVLLLDAIDIVRFTPGADKKDLLLAASVLPLESFMVMREAWTFWSLGRALRRIGMNW